MERKPDSPEVLERFAAQLPLVDVIARQTVRSLGRSVEYDDLVGYGREGLLDAARRYDPDRGVPFRAYANFRVRGAILDGVRQMSRLPRRAHERLRGLEAAMLASEGAAEDAFAPPAPGAGSEQAEHALSEHLAAMATALAIGLVAPSARGEEGEATTQSAGEDPEQSFGHAELVDLVRREIEQLPSDEATLVRRHYLEGERFDHVAAELGLSKSWASRLHTRAIGRLTKRLRGAID